jgi:hypothetical protein
VAVVQATDAVQLGGDLAAERIGADKQAQLVEGLLGGEDAGQGTGDILGTRGTLHQVGQCNLDPGQLFGE